MSASRERGTAVSFEIPADLLESFEKAEAYLQKTYGASPPIQDLVRLWIACATSWDAVTEFESAVRELDRGTLSPDKEGHFNEQLLHL